MAIFLGDYMELFMGIYDTVSGGIHLVMFCELYGTILEELHGNILGQCSAQFLGAMYYTIYEGNVCPYFSTYFGDTVWHHFMCSNISCIIKTTLLKMKLGW